MVRDEYGDHCAANAIAMAALTRPIRNPT